MKITEIELYHVEVPVKHTFWPTWIPGYPQTHNRFTLIKLVTDEGIEGSAGTAMVNPLLCFTPLPFKSLSCLQPRTHVEREGIMASPFAEVYGSAD